MSLLCTPLSMSKPLQVHFAPHLVSTRTWLALNVSRKAAISLCILTKSTQSMYLRSFALCWLKFSGWNVADNFPESACFIGSQTDIWRPRYRSCRPRQASREREWEIGNFRSAAPSSANASGECRHSVSGVTYGFLVASKRPFDHKAEH